MEVTLAPHFWATAYKVFNFTINIALTAIVIHYLLTRRKIWRVLAEVEHDTRRHFKWDFTQVYNRLSEVSKQTTTQGEMIKTLETKQAKLSSRVDNAEDSIGKIRFSPQAEVVKEILEKAYGQNKPLPTTHLKVKARDMSELELPMTDEQIKERDNLSELGNLKD